MGSKRSKKSKQEQELLPEKINMNNTEDTEDIKPKINECNENNGVVPTLTKAPKRRKKAEGVDEVPRKVKRTSEGRVNKRKTKSENIPNNGVVVQAESSREGQSEKNETTEKRKEPITWPDQDVVELINRMESNIPEKDVLSYRSRVEKINWNDVAFNNYSSEQCKKTWLQIQKRIRRFRLLSEVLSDAKEWINTPKTNNVKATKSVRAPRHPDMPRRPLSSYLLFYLNQKDKILSETPGLDASDLTKIVGQIYKTLPPEKREIYEKMAAASREEYAQKLKLFFETHPEIEPPPPQRRGNADKTAKVVKEKPVKVEKEKVVKVEKEKPVKTEKLPSKDKLPKVEKVPKVERTPKVSKDKSRGKPGRLPRGRPPKKWQTPFGLYYTSELKNMEPGTDKQAFREKCKEQYKLMSDKKKICWINLAEQDLIRYQEEAKAYKQKNPEYKAHKVKSILTKREKASKERALGKPGKPPNSAYALYSRVMLQSEEIKSVNPKDRMNYIASKWKNVTEEEQNNYKDQVTNLMEQYRQDYQAYVATLPQEEQRKILAQSKRKRGRRGSVRKRRPEKRRSVRPKPPPATKLKFVEPEQPPISACKYFATVYKGEEDPIKAWKLLKSEEKRKYEEELVKKKQAYIIEFEKFLKSLSKEELEEFSKTRQQQVPSDDEDSSECSSGSEGEEEDDENENAEKGQNEDDEDGLENAEVKNEENGHVSESE